MLEDHLELKRLLEGIKGKFILSYNDCDYIRKLYRGYNIVEVERVHSLIQKIQNPDIKNLLSKIINNEFRYNITKLIIIQRIMIMSNRGIIMAKIHLSKLLGEKRMTQKQLSELTGIRPNTINEWYHDIAVSLRVEHIDRICEVLDCSVSELLEVIPNKIPKTGKNLIIEEHGNRKESKGQ